METTVTTIADLISKVMVIIDDIRLNEMLRENPAAFYRKMCGYIDIAMPMLSRPPELYKHITKGYTASQFEDAAWVSTEASLTDETILETGLTGYDFMGVTSISADGTNVDSYSEATYDPETGEVTFPIQTEAGITYDIDFYKDGSFENLTPTMERLFVLAIAIVWDERLNHNWLNLTPKIKDSSFETLNESNYMEKLTIRMKENRAAFYEELRKYEQDIAYSNVVPEIIRRPKLI